MGLQEHAPNVSSGAISRDRPVVPGADLAEIVAEFGEAVREPLAARIGRAEDQIKDPVARLVRAAGEKAHLKVVSHAEAPLAELGARPDFAIVVADGPIGFVEVKRPGKGADPDAWPKGSHDGRQWKNLRLLHNVLYTDGREWALYRDGVRLGPIAKVVGDLERAGRSLRPADDGLGWVLEEFLYWPARRSLRSLVRTTARLCRYLREEVAAVLEYEKTARETPFTRLAEDWRRTLFPRLTQEQFTDAYAQTITFALMLARNAGIAFEGLDLPMIGHKLSKRNALIGRALTVLTGSLAADNLIAIESLRRIIGAVDWDQLNVTTSNAHALLYETFLEHYDHELRQRSGSYYTPDRMARAMVRFTDIILRRQLDRSWGYASDDVIVVDPAMGTGTFLVEIIDQVAETVAHHQGPGARDQRLRDLFHRRLIGFERQLTPYAVSELRLHEALKTKYGVDVPEHEMRFLTDTFEDPDTQELEFGSMYAELLESREGANKVKRRVPVMVIIGNPPYVERARSRDPAPWIEDPREPGKPFDLTVRPSLDEFRQHDPRDFKLTATWVFYWRWAIWKAFEAHPDHPAGIVAFITPSSYLTSDSFAGMRAHLKKVADEAWIIDISPERHQPPVRTRLFPKVQQPLCIAVLARYGPGNDKSPARVQYRAVTGTSDEKLRALECLELGGAEWKDCPEGWSDPFRPTVDPNWLSFVSLGDIFPWQSTGVTANRTWVIAPDREVLRRRWRKLIRSNPEDQNALLKTTRDRTIDSVVPPVPGHPQHSGTLRVETSLCPHIVPYAYRSFDRQYLILDSRVIDFPRSSLWAVAGPQQVFISEMHTNPVDAGPAVAFAATPPNNEYFQGSHGGRILPLYRDAAAMLPNVAPELLRLIAQAVGLHVSADDLLAYVATVAAHPGYTRRYWDDLAVPGVRIPLSADQHVWKRAIEIGREVVRLHTLATRADSAPSHTFNEDMPNAPKIITPIPYTADTMPAAVKYDRESQTLWVGSGQIAPVPAAIWEYRVGKMRVVDKWIGYRLKQPRGRKPATPLDEIKATTWTAAFNDDLLRLLHVLAGLIKLEPLQDMLLHDVIEGPLIGTNQLCEVGILPVPGVARKSMQLADPDDQIDI